MKKKPRQNINQDKLVVILGPTATGKTKLAVKLAQKYNGEIISADSRQVFRGMDIGTGKDLKDYKAKKIIKHHLIDIISPRTNFNVAKYQQLAYSAINDVLKRGKLPFLVGGTGLYIDAVLKGYIFNEIKNKKGGIESRTIRNKLDRLSLPQLLTSLKKIDPATYGTIDRKNRRRVQRALEIYYETGRPKSAQPESAPPGYEILIIGIKFPLAKIYQKIDSRLESRIKEGMVAEIRRLRRRRVSWKRLDEFGLEYRYVSRYLRGQLSYERMLEELKQAIHHFAKRQLTWFKRNKDIIWVNGYLEAAKKIKKFID